MLRSLWSGVSGIQAHQLAIDVEGNNIANVNTVGYKYSRANFSDLLSQSVKLATAPQGDRGGTNELQIGLGSKINSTTRVFQQGSIQNTDRPTDIAIQGEGFLVLTPNNGTTYQYSRNGDLTFDAGGNLVDSYGLKVQGWLKNLNPLNNDSDVTSTSVDTTAPITNIVIEPGLRIPSKDTTNIEMKANLNSGKKIVNKTSLYGTEALNGRIYSKDVDATKISGTKIINEKSLDKFGKITNFNKHGYEVGTDMGAIANLKGDVIGMRSAKFATSFKRENPNDDAAIKAENDEIERLNKTSIDGQGIMVSILDREKKVTDTDRDRNVYFQFRYTDGNKLKGHPPVSRINTVNGTILKYDEDVKTFRNKPLSVLKPLDTIDTYPLQSGKTAKNIKIVYYKTDEELRVLMQSALRDPGQRGPAIDVAITDANPSGKEFPLSRDKLDALIEAAPKDAKGNLTDLAAFYTTHKIIIDPLTRKVDFNWQNNVDFSVGITGKMSLTSHKSDDKPAEWKMESIQDKNTTTNDLFTELISPLGGIIDPGTKITSVPIKVPSHAASIHIYDSLGSRHSLRFEFTKTSTEGWAWQASVPEPATLGGGYPPDENLQRGGTISFTENGALKGFSPPTLAFTGNNGSIPNQIIQIDFGTLGDFDGISQLDAPSSSKGILQDGFSGGDLVGTRIDDVGTIIGSFSNSRSFALGQLALASFTNNAGLKSTGNNLFSSSSNSGNAVIGTASSGGKGAIQASSLELSNVDLSRSLTQLIALQRGFQANGKSITTSDDLLNTLIQLKN